MQPHDHNPQPQRPPLGGRAIDGMREFLREYRKDGKLWYYEALSRNLSLQYYGLDVDFEDLLNYFTHEDPDNYVPTLIQKHYYTLLPHLERLVAEFARDVNSEAVIDAAGEHIRFSFCIIGIADIQMLHEIRTEHIGQLLALEATITRTLAVAPLMVQGAFHCAVCGTLMENIPQDLGYREPLFCSGEECANRTHWTLDHSHCIFENFQRLRVQQSPDSIKPGAMPLSMDVLVLGNGVESCKAGDRVLMHGSPVVLRDQDQKRGRRSHDQATVRGTRGLKGQTVQTYQFRLSFLATSIHPIAHDQIKADGRFLDDSIPMADALRMLGLATRERIREISQLDDVYTKLAESIAPEIFGHVEVKRAILLMLLRGVPKNAKGTSIRGDINVCLVGDPGVAKSQMLKWVAEFVPRTVYTSGRASSAAGLTATVVKDPDTGVWGIEAGALMLADRGICCIDEFEKLSPQDQSAIHEAMEQQTISISKAGISTRLNARTSILAAANPIGGRYDKKLTLRGNLSLPPAIMSRFDLVFVIVDEANPETDAHIGDHILRSIRSDGKPVVPPVQREDLLTYIFLARKLKPKLTQESADRLIQYFELFRGQDTEIGRPAYRMTVRQLEALVRLSEAIAKLHLSQEVHPHYVDEAAQLLRRSRILVAEEPIRCPLPNSTVASVAALLLIDDSQGEPPITHEDDEGDFQPVLEETTPIETEQQVDARNFQLIERAIVHVLLSLRSEGTHKEVAIGPEGSVSVIECVQAVIAHLEQLGQLQSITDPRQKLQQILAVLLHMIESGTVMRFHANDETDSQPDLSRSTLFLNPNFVPDYGLNVASTAESSFDLGTTTDDAAEQAPGMEEQ